MSSSITPKVINVKVEHLRPKFQNLKEWVEADPNKHVYIGRPGVVFVNGVRYPPVTHASCKLFQNPFKLGKDGSGSSRKKVLSDFRKYAVARLEVDQEFRNAVKELSQQEGKLLGCWCKPEVCHGDILIELSKELNSTDSKEKEKEEPKKDDNTTKRRQRKDNDEETFQ
jgi:hypothetical protein